MLKLRKGHLFFSLCAFLALRALPAAAAPSFTAFNDVIFSSLTAHSVIASTDGFRMYLTSSSYEVLSATSSDQVAWSLEPGIRLSTKADTLDASSITSVGVYVSSNPSDPLRMFYVGISSNGLYSMLSATSTDGLVWKKCEDFFFQSNSGLGYLGSPSPIAVDSSVMRLFYVADSAGGNSQANYTVYAASSPDGGATLSSDGSVLSENAYQVAVTTRADGKTRLYYTAPLSGETTASQLLSGLSSDGLVFTVEDGVRLSTPSSSGGFVGLAVLRATETFRWRAFGTYGSAGSTETALTHALTLIPVIDSFSPDTVLKTQSNVPFTLTGEILTTQSTVTFTLSGTTVTADGLATSDGLTLTGIVDPYGVGSGVYTLTVTNPGEYQASLSSALFIDLPGGSVTITDNLFRPLSGQSAKIDVQIFEAGNVKVDLFTVAGGRVATLYDGPMPEGLNRVTWSGRTALGNVVASGLYLLSVRGPKLKTVERIVVIK